ncbi:MAG: galactose-1-phosphate uridylyltransferase, partial [Armatimonadetes bacterium]|nr:galactose-1-phosphate uridylyltransferase [Armatimonadota bacterium]
MPELRKDPITRRWVIIATERAARPTDFITTVDDDRSDPARCPFCEGREAQTPPELFAVRRDGSAANGPGWRVRVVSNKYPALRIEGDTTRTKVGIFTRMDGVGAHEVILETPDHDTHLALMSQEEIADVIRAYYHRYEDLDRDERFEYLLLFRNHGRVAGASLSHPHSQLIALPMVPKRISEEMESAERYFVKEGSCIYCDLIAQERASGERIVYENERFLAVAPYAARFPFETWILPKAHLASFGGIGPEDVAPMANALKTVLLKLALCVQNPPYNLIVHTAPYAYPRSPAYHWHREIMP